jgi:hypothetical protein
MTPPPLTVIPSGRLTERRKCLSKVLEVLPCRAPSNLQVASVLRKPYPCWGRPPDYHCRWRAARLRDRRRICRRQLERVTKSFWLRRKFQTSPWRNCESVHCLCLIIETTGGFIEVVERIYNVFRKHYTRVDFIVPNFAYSAGTVLVLSGDEIYMDYFSVLGPIDPQLSTENDRFVSGLGYLAKYKELTDTINKAANPESVRAELAYLLKRFDPAELFDMEQAKDHAEDLLEEWLSRHKFKDWTENETTRAPVSDTDRRARARAIAETLGNPERWHSHGRGIGMRELTGEEIKLKIKDFGADADLNGKIRPYYDLFINYCKKMGANAPTATMIHTRNGVRRV